MTSHSLNYSVHDGSHWLIGCASTLLAVSVPDSLLNYAGKLVFAVLTAVISSLVSRYVMKRLERRLPQGKP